MTLQVSHVFPERPWPFEAYQTINCSKFSRPVFDWSSAFGGCELWGNSKNNCINLPTCQSLGARIFPFNTRCLWWTPLKDGVDLLKHMPGARHGSRFFRFETSETWFMGIPSDPKACWCDIPHRIHGTGIFTYIYHEFKPNVGKYTIHGWYGYPQQSLLKTSY